MADLTGRALRLVQRLVGPRGHRPAGEPDPGIPAAGEGGAAVARVEAALAGASAGAGEGRGALATATGLGLAGLRATAFTSGPELAAELDQLAQAAGWGVPLVVHLNVRAGGGAGGAVDIGHGAYHAAATAGAGAFHLFAANAQEAVDFALIARRVAEEALVPAVVAMDVETALGVEDLLLPSPALLARFLGDPGDTVHPATPAQELLWGRHRRRVPRRHDPERPLRTGGPLGPEAHALAGAARRAFVEPHLAALLAGAFAAFAEATGRAHGALSTHRVDGARVVLLAQGAAVETAEAVADALRASGVKVGVIGLRALRPFPAAELVTALRGARAVAVLERVDAPPAGDPPLAAELRGALDRARDNHRAGAEVHPGLPALADGGQPRLASALYGLGGFPLRAADLAGYARELDASLGKRGRGDAGTDAARRFAAPVYLGLEVPPAATPYPKRQALLDALSQSYPQAARLGFRAAGPGPRLTPEGATVLAVHRRAGEGGEGLAGDAGRLLHRLAAGHLRGRRDLASGWGTPCVDRVVHAPGAVRDPGDGVAADVVLWHRPAPPTPADAAALLAGLAPGGALLVETPGDRAEDLEAWWIALPAALRAAAAAGTTGAAGDARLRLVAVAAGGDEPPALREERLLGALLAVLTGAAGGGRPEITPRKLRQARRDLLAAEGGAEASGAPSDDRRLEVFQAGFDRVQPIDPARFAALPARSFTASGEEEDDEVAVPAAARRRLKADDALDNLPAFWDRTGILYRRRETAELAPDPYLAVGAVPPLTAVLRDHSGARTMLPAFDPAKCTGCGACWTACPDSAVAPVATGAGALLDFGIARARERGQSAEALRMVAGKLGAGVDEELAARGGGPAGPLFETALDHLLERSPLPAERKAAAREAWAAVREEIAALPVAKTEVWGNALFSLAINPDACKGCGLCVAACEAEALTAGAGAKDSPARSRAARTLWRLADALPAPAADALERARAHPDAGPLAAALATAEARRVMVGGHGAEAGSGEAIALRQLLGAAAALLEPERARLLAELTELEGRLSAAIHDGLAGALPGADLAALARGLDAIDRPDTDLGGLAARIETAFDGGRVDVVRLRRLVAAARALADLRWRLESGEGGMGRAPFAVAFGAGSAAAWAGAFPDNPFGVPVTVDATADATALARGLLAGQLAGAVEGIRALRRARIELDKPAEAERRTEALAGLGWRDLSAEERRLCPPLFLVLSEVAMGGAALGGVLDLLAGDLPLKVVALAEAGLGLAAGASGPVPRADLGLVALSLPAATVAQTSIAHPSHLAAALTAALAADGPALVRVLAPSPRRHGFAADRTLARAREAVDAGAFRLFVRAGGAPPVAEAAPAPAPAAPADTAEHQAEMAALRADYEARLGALAGEIRRDTAQRVRARLLALATRPASATSVTAATPATATPDAGGGGEEARP